MSYELDNAHDQRLAAKICDRWCYFGSSSKSTENKTATTSYDPAQVALRTQNLQNTQAGLGSVGPYTGPLTAGFNPTQVQSQGILSGIATDPRYAATGQSAINATQGILGANLPTNITPQTYDPAQLAGKDLTPYLNPFQSQVIDASIAQNQHARDQQGVADNAAATAANAFGGTRQAVQRAETTAGYDRNNQQNLAALNSANFSQAQQGALSDIAAKNTAGQFNATQTQGAEQNSFANALAAAGLKLNAAGQLEALNQADLGRAAQQGGILSAVGDTQQQQQQSEYSNNYNAYLQEFNRQLAQQQAINQALGLIPIGSTTNENGTSTTSSNPGAGGILGGIASLGLAAATGGSSLGLTAGLGGLGGLGGLFGNSLKGQSSGPMFGYT
jgi:hypothetical protein